LLQVFAAEYLLWRNTVKNAHTAALS
jgi:hypothetical protein